MAECFAENAVNRHKDLYACCLGLQGTKRDSLWTQKGKGLPLVKYQSLEKHNGQRKIVLGVKRDHWGPLEN